MHNILIADDSQSMRQMVSMTLREANYQVTATEDGVEALDSAQNNHYDLIITDVNMPNMDGLTLISKVRELAAYRFTPLLVLTTESSAESKAKGKKVGATGWIVKPFDPDKLLQLVARVIN